MIKTLEELKKVRKNSFEKVALRKHGDLEGIEVRVGVSNKKNPEGREILNSFMDDVADHSLNNVKVILVDNYGDHQIEPIVGINAPGQAPTIYENVNALKAHEIFEKHIKGGQQHL